jgi:serine phosphatase RsbU (regulator of sigma subunit)
MKIEPKHIKGLLAGIAVFAFLFYVARGCRLREDYRELKDQYETYRSIAKADNEMKMKTIAEANRVILAKDAEISRLSGEVVLNQDALHETQEDLRVLQALEPTIKDKDELITNLRGQVSRLTEMFNLSQNTVSNQLDIIKAWELKYNAQVEVSESWKSMYESEVTLRKLAEGLVSNLEVDVRKYRAMGRVKTVMVVALGGYLAYSIGKDIIK